MHGREHLNVKAWMEALQKFDKQTRLAFNLRMWGFIPDQDLLPNVKYQAAFLLSDPDDLKYHEKVIIEGLDLFKKLFGYKAEYFVPPNGHINNKLNQILVNKLVSNSDQHLRYKKRHWVLENQERCFIGLGKKIKVD